MKEVIRITMDIMLDEEKGEGYKNTMNRWEDEGLIDDCVLNYSFLEDVSEEYERNGWDLD